MPSPQVHDEAARTAAPSQPCDGHRLQQPTEDTPDTPPKRFDWGLFAWFALLSWAGLIILIISVLVANYGS